MAKKDKEFITTPVGVGKYIWLTKPDVKFNKDGKYYVTMLFDTQDNKVQEFINTLKGKAQKFYDKTVADLKKKKKHKEAKELALHVPYTEVYDDDGEVTTQVEFKASCNAQFKDNNDEIVKIKIPLFDAKGKLIENRSELRLFTGTTLRINGEITEFSGFGRAGVSVRLKAAQIIKIADTNASGEVYGFTSQDNEEDENTFNDDNSGVSDDSDF